jgi:hypothetical protein
MFASIQSRDDEAPSDSPGKTSEITSSVLNIKARDVGLGIGRQRQFLEITGANSEVLGSGSKSGHVKTMNRKLTLQLDASDLQQILTQAIKVGLVRVPGQQEVAQAAELLVKAMASMASSDVGASAA